MFRAICKEALAKFIEFSCVILTGLKMMFLICRYNYKMDKKKETPKFNAVCKQHFLLFEFGVMMYIIIYFHQLR